MNISNFKPGQGEEIAEDDSKLTPRSLSRAVALQALYQWQLNRSEISDITKEFNEEGRLTGIDVPLYQDIVNTVVSETEAFDELYGQFLDRSVAMIDPVEKIILRIGVYELKYKPEIPYKVVLNESVELAKRFGAEESHKYINGILDKVAQQVRSLEVAAINASN
ncbi:transcription antitermination factor NusB [Hydrogenovibrio sp. JE_KL2]|jgi:N utilization substance protein B|uniref:transcription antitermination factor NusB n=1 Tax=Hydrogenovibrio sp. JE_KL2 TaxID=2651188 RepID=UPI00128DB4AD|nr:transcription antitermination factor NusB [Hydrogenovibrio sp. JE_KL2]MBD3822839.1 transcription antitermination factor NusB [Thiotrichales bacterium]MBN2605867.1 transcription antitermination factor NusB [Thiotrichales bacterium]MPQ76227.1 transcription antitermination factor NusB [Hydrogenovibrio sp. JE_KL2]